MTLKNTAKSSLVIFMSMVITAIVTTIFDNLLLSPKNSLFFGFIDHLFIIDMITLFLALIMFLTQSGAYNSIAYSTRLFRARISDKYRHELMASASIEESDINTYLRETYLYRTVHYKYTYSLLIPSVLLFAGLMVYISLVY